MAGPLVAFSPKQNNNSEVGSGSPPSRVTEGHDRLVPPRSSLSESRDSNISASMNLNQNLDNIPGSRFVDHTKPEEARLGEIGQTINAAFKGDAKFIKAGSYDWANAPAEIKELRERELSYWQKHMHPAQRERVGEFDINPDYLIAKYGDTEKNQLEHQYWLEFHDATTGMHLEAKDTDLSRQNGLKALTKENHDLALGHAAERWVPRSTGLPNPPPNTGPGPTIIQTPEIDGLDNGTMGNPGITNPGNSSLRSGQSPFTASHGWDGSFPSPSSVEGGVLPPSRARADGRTEYRFQNANGDWITSQNPYYKIRNGGPGEPIQEASGGKEPPAWLPRAEAGKAGLYFSPSGERVFVNEYGEPKSHFSSDFLAPPWLAAPNRDPRTGRLYGEANQALGLKQERFWDYSYEWGPGMSVIGPHKYVDTSAAGFVKPGLSNTAAIPLDDPSFLKTRKEDFIHAGEIKRYTFTFTDNPPYPAGTISALNWEPSQKLHVALRILGSEAWSQSGRQLEDQGIDPELRSQTFPTDETGRILPGTYTVEVEGLSGEYPKDGSGNRFLLGFMSGYFTGSMKP